MEYIIKNAEESMKDEILAFYNSMVGTKYCAWTMQYPSMDNIEKDMSCKNLYVCLDEKGIAGTISIDTDDQTDALDVWTISSAREISRIAVRSDLRGRGLAASMVKQIMQELKNRGYEGVHLLVHPDNLPAVACYAGLGFNNLGHAELYDTDWFCCERII